MSQRMIPDPVKLRQMAEARLDENYKFRQFLKHHRSLSSEEVDSVVSETAEKVWEEMDCTACANCCRVVVPTFCQDDIDRLAGRLGISSSEFVSKYLKSAESPEDGPWIIRERPCPFLKENRCSVYEHRPTNCRDYPYLGKPAFTSRTLRMIDRLGECPIVFEVWEELKRATGFRR